MAKTRGRDERPPASTGLSRKAKHRARAARASATAAKAAAEVRVARLTNSVSEQLRGSARLPDGAGKKRALVDMEHAAIDDLTERLTVQRTGVGFASTAHNLRVVVDKSKSQLSLAATAPLVAPSQEWWKRAKANSLQHGWSLGMGGDGLDEAQRRSLVHYEGDVLSEVQLGARVAAGGARTHVKLFVRQHGTRASAEDLVRTRAIDAGGVRATVARCVARRAGGDAQTLAALGLGCLSDAASRKLSTTTPVRDGRRMFLVPLREIKPGEPITHWYNWQSLER